MANPVIRQINTIRWPVGSVVIHRCDVALPDMLARVVGYTDEGLAMCKFIDARTDRFLREYYGMETIDCDVKYLLDPRRFGMEVPHDAR